ncbi:MAG: hypothetical protein BWK75_02325 [Candidatus Altiarchaeales archaeon A3]|nr:MAG: hypothetical protein BWK75_02325 [Candidatus Altiarchaeales archaeon A3]
MDFKTGILVMLVGIAVVGMMASSVSADTYVYTGCSHGVYDDDYSQYSYPVVAECYYNGYGYSSATAWGNIVSKNADSNGWGQTCGAHAEAGDGWTDNVYAYC